MDSPPLTAVDLGGPRFGTSGGFSDDDNDDEFLLAIQDTANPVSVERTFKDNIHDYITLDQRICRIIDTPHFQRLRHIQQLGTSSYVWPAASHSRFAHCLGTGIQSFFSRQTIEVMWQGVAHLANKLIKTLQKKQPELKITDEDVFCVTAAGLCHDLGHGPWSHVWDSMFIPRALPNKKWRHEDASEMMFDALIKLDHVQVSEREAKIIKALIAGEASRCSSLKPPVKPFLFEIIANKRNGLDIDKFDYIARDNHAIGQGENISLNKLILSARVINNEICYDIKDANSVLELCWARFSLHKRIYNHKTAKAIEHMLIDGLLAAEPYMHIANQIEDPDRYLYLTDDIKTRIQATTSPELAPARAILNRIDLRQLYSCVDFRAWPWHLRTFFRGRVNARSIVAAAQRYAADTKDLSIVDGLTEQHVIVDIAEMHYGMKEKNPLRFVKFYSKKHPDRATHAESGDISQIMPAIFAEFLVRIYTRETKYYGIIQTGYRQLLKDLHDEESLDLGSPELRSPALPDLGPGQQNRALSRAASTRLAPDEDDTAVDGFGQNHFTTVSPNYKGNERR